MNFIIPIDAVFNGSDLGKLYSGQAFIKRFDNWAADEREGQEKVDRGVEWPQLERYDHSQANSIKDTAKDFLDLMKVEKFYPEPINPYLKRRRKKKKRGASL